MKMLFQTEGLSSKICVNLHTCINSLTMTYPNVSVSAGIKLTLSALLDGKNINAGGHKLGLGLEFQA